LKYIQSAFLTYPVSQHQRQPVSVAVFAVIEGGTANIPLRPAGGVEVPNAAETFGRSLE
jgi:hypothetical protein